METPTNFSNMIDSSGLPSIIKGSDIVDLSTASTGIWASSLTESSVGDDVVELATTQAELNQPSIPDYKVAILGWVR